MKIYAEEYNFQNDTKLVEVRLFGIQGEWMGDYPEKGGIHFDELFTSYRAASEYLMGMGYRPVAWQSLFFDTEWDLMFVRDTGEDLWECEIAEMEVVK
jgi:hypothetical protein